MDVNRKRQKVSSACERCRRRKLGCDQYRPCQLCVRAGAICIPRRGTVEQNDAANVEAGQSPDQIRSHYEEKAVLPEQSIVELSTRVLSREYLAYDTSALPGGREMPGSSSGSAGPWQDIIGLSLPSRGVLDPLVDQFFNSVNWFMMVFHEEHFRRRYENLIVSSHEVAPPDSNFLWVTLLVLGLGAHYSSLSASTAPEGYPLRQFAETLLTQVEYRFCRIINSPNVEAIQICILLGSFHLFNGRPTAGLGILGSAVKVAQVVGLHRESMWKGISDINRESRRRSWWALEVFDKYAAIAFGRTCTIDETDCTVAPPVDIRLEGQLVSRQDTLLEYHRWKFELYRLMGPFLGRRNQTNHLETVRNLHHQLLLWWRRLPSSLRLSTYKDDVPSEQLSLCQLQALSLQLTYDNLQIILHRSVAFGDSSDSMNSSGASTRMHGSSLHREQLVESALRTSELGQYHHTLQACRRTHAVMHVGICLFTAGVVLCAVCLAEPLSTTSAKAKIGIMAILHLHRDSSSNEHLLSAQSARILEDSVAAVMQAEQQLILGNSTSTSVNVTHGNSSEGYLAAPVNQDNPQVTGNQQSAESEAFLNPLQEVFAQHLHNQTVPDIAGSSEESPMLGLEGFSWNGGQYLMTDSGLADANQLWLWSDGALQDFS